MHKKDKVFQIFSVRQMVELADVGWREINSSWTSPFFNNKKIMCETERWWGTKNSKNLELLPPNTDHLITRYFSVGIFVPKLWRNTLWRFLKNSAGIPFFSQKGVGVYKKGAKAPSFLGGLLCVMLERKFASAVPAAAKMYWPSFPWVSIGKIPRKYRPILTENTEQVNNSK